MKKQYTNINLLKQLIDEHDVISFDIFDTLLIRPYLDPYLMFDHIEEYAGMLGFAQARKTAEGKARKKAEAASLEETTLDDIYQELPLSFRYLKNTELEFERRLLKPNKDIFEAYHYALEKGKRILIISDMYLPKSFLNNVLKEKGYTGYEHFYISSETKKAKYSGNMYKFILEEKNIDPKSMLHIGDSLESDVKRPRQNGITSFHYPKLSDQFFQLKENKRYKDIQDTCQSSLTISMILAAIIEKWNEDRSVRTTPENYWQVFGYSMGGCLCYGFTKFVIETAKKHKIKNLLFIARDGYVLQKTFDILAREEQIKCFYTYAQRVLRIRTLLTWTDNQSMDIILDMFQEKSGEIPLNIPDKLTPTEEKEAFIHKNIHLLKPYAEEKRKQYFGFLKSIGLDTDANIAIVDSGAATFAAQTLLSEILGKDIPGIYMNVDRKYALMNNLRYFDWVESNSINSILALLEFIMTSPEPPIKDIKCGKPVYLEKPSEEELKRNRTYPEVLQGIISFIMDLDKRLGPLKVYFSPLDIEKLFNIFVLTMSDLDVKMMTQIHHPTNISHSNYSETLYDRIKKYRQKNLTNIYLLQIKILTVADDYKYIHYKLFGKIPFIRVPKNTPRKGKTIQLLGFIPLIKIKERKTSNKYYLFGLLKFMKVKKSS